MHSQDRFATTRWSMVMQSVAGTVVDGGALGDLARRYWYPLYAYVRRCGHAPGIAQDISRVFLREFSRMDTPPDGPESGQRLRDYLLDRLHRFLGEDWRGAVASDPEDANLPPPPDLEARYQRDTDADASPDEAYERAFALEVLSRALRRLQAEATQTGHRPMYETLREFLAAEPPPGMLDALGQRLGIPPLALLVALKRLRQRLRELATQELADTVASADDLVAEQVALNGALRGMK